MKKSMKSRNHTVGSQVRVDEAQNVVIFPNVLTSDIYIDSDDKIEGSVSNALFENKNNMITAQVSRVGLKFVDMYFNIPNCNKRNNTYTVMVIGSPVVVGFIIPEGNYLTAASLFNAFKLAMQAAVLLQTGLAFIVSFVENLDTNLWVMSADIDFKFTTCNGISYGNNLHGISYTNGYVPSLEIIPKLYYTRYIDIMITELVDAKIMSHKFSETKRFNEATHLTRLYIPFVNIIDPLTSKVISKQSTNFQRENININHYPFRHRDVSDIEIVLVDEFQEPLFFDTQNIVTVNPITSIDSEIPYIKYNLVLSIIA